jgi:hypothetical protein
VQAEYSAFLQGRINSPNFPPLILDSRDVIDEYAKILKLKEKCWFAI